MENWTKATLERRVTARSVDWTLRGFSSIGKRDVYVKVPEDIRSFDFGDQAKVELACEIVLERGRLAKLRLLDQSVSSKAAQVAAEKETAAMAEQSAKQAVTGVKFASAKQRPSKDPGHFHNPYNFIPSPEGQPSSESPLGRFPPASHDRYHSDLWTGSIEVELTASTPVLILDTANKQMTGAKRDHPVFGPLKRNGKAHISPTSLKGPLRAAYEAITVSRFPTWKGHDEKLARRMGSREGLLQVPMRVSDCGEYFEVMVGTHSAAIRNGNFAAIVPTPPAGEPPGKLAYAANLPRYQAKTPPGPENESALKYSDTGELPLHGQDCYFLATEYAKYEERNGKVSLAYKYWQIKEIRHRNNQFSKPRHGAKRFEKPEKAGRYETGSADIAERGFVCITNQNIGNKHDEKVFFSQTQPPKIEISDKHRKFWSALVKSYHEEAKKHIKERRLDDAGDTDAKTEKMEIFRDDKVGEFAFSRHVIRAEVHDEFVLKRNNLVFGQFNQNGELTGVYPVQISRDLAQKSPDAFLPKNLRPAASEHELSPADRVFGWVSQKEGPKDGTNMHRGQLRIRGVDFKPASTSDTGLDDFAPLPLAILGQPKPQQFGFYLGADSAGSPLEQYQPRNDFYSESRHSQGGRLRGRKVYPHHKAAAAAATLTDYWNPRGNPGQPLAGPDARAFFREFIHPGSQEERTSKQNRSITGWIARGATFKVAIDIVNLNDAELGALIWLLTQENAHLRLGYGKPLGFGSMTTRITGGHLQRGHDLAQEYRELAAVIANDGVPDAGHPSIEEYKKAFVALFKDNGPFDENPVIKAYLASARGFTSGLPLHYPRAEAHHQKTKAGTIVDGERPAVKPSPDGENFNWFVSNTKKKDREVATLRLLDEGGAPLPYLYYKPAPIGKQGRQDGGQRGGPNRGHQNSGPGQGRNHGNNGNNNNRGRR